MNEQADEHTTQEGKEEVIVSTMRVEDSPIKVPGSEIRQCYLCGGDVLLSPATKKILQERHGDDFKMLCNRCRPPISVFLEETVEPLTTEQMTEFRDAWRELGASGGS